MLNSILWILNDNFRPLLVWLANYFVHSTVLISVAWLVARGLKSHALRDLLWKFALVGGLLTSVAQAWIGSASQSTWVMPAVAVEGTLIGLPRGLPSESLAEVIPVVSSVSVVEAGLPWTVWGIAALLALWACTALFLLLRFANAHLVLRRALAKRSLVSTNAAVRRLRTVTRNRRLRVTSSAAIASPIALGTAEICVPERWVELVEGEQLGMLAHEAAHLVRRDSAWLLIASLLERVFFFQPLQRIVRRGMQLDAEFLCDEWAARKTGEPVALARCLSRVAEWMQHEPQSLPASIPAMAATRSTLVTRVEELLSGKQHSSHRATGTVLCITLIASLVLFACVGPRVSSEEPLVETASATPGVQLELVESVMIDAAPWQHADSAPDGPVALEVDVQEASTVVVRFDREGGLRLEARGAMSQHSLETADGRDEFHHAIRFLATLAKRTAAQENSVSPISLTIKCEENTPYVNVLRLMRLCGTRDVMIADIRLSGARGEYAVPLPTGAGTTTEPPAPWIELRLEAAGEEASRTVHYTVDVCEWTGLETQEENETHLEIMETMQTSDLDAVRAKLDELRGKTPKAYVTVDARPGVLFDEVTRLLDQVILVGYTDISFVGRIE